MNNKSEVEGMEKNTLVIAQTWLLERKNKDWKHIPITFEVWKINGEDEGEYWVKMSFYEPGTEILDDTECFFTYDPQNYYHYSKYSRYGGWLGVLHDVKVQVGMILRGEKEGLIKND